MTSISHEEIEIARLRIKKSPNIEKLFHKWLELENPELGNNVLIDLLSDPESVSGISVSDLEKTLTDGLSTCENFGDIFKISPSSSIDVKNGQLIDIFAEIEAFRWLRLKEFKDLKKLKPKRVGGVWQKTVDYVCKRDGKDFAVEVTRLGVPTSHVKIVKPYSSQYANLGDGIVVPMIMYTSDTAYEEIENTLSDAAIVKLTQIVEFFSNQPTNYQGLIMISTGHGIMSSRKNTRAEVGALPRTYREALYEVWKVLSPQEPRLKALILLDHKNDYSTTKF